MVKTPKRIGKWLDKHVKQGGHNKKAKSQDGSLLPEGIDAHESSRWQPEASQRAIAEMVGVANATINRDLDVTNVTKNKENQTEKQSGGVANVTPAIPADNARVTIF